MKKILYAILISALIATVASCWKENIPKAGDSRYQITDLLATPGDEEVLLSWKPYKDAVPTGYLISYVDATAGTIELEADAEDTSYLVDNLANGTDYIFNVQAIYGKNISGAVSISGKPATTRISVSTLSAEAGNGYVSLYWSAPSLLVSSYELSYYADGDESGEKSVALESSSTSYLIDNLTNGVNYVFSLTAIYAKGKAEPATVKAMPAAVTPYVMDVTTAAVNQPLKFTFNRAGIADASDITWTFPDATSLTGDIVSKAFSSVGKQTVVLSATIAGSKKSWNLKVTIREYVICNDEWEQSGANYNGFKGSVPVFSPDGKTVYCLTFNKIASLYAYDIATGTKKWNYKPEVDASSYNPLTVNPVTGDIYYGTTTAGQFYAVTSSGSLKWQFTGAQSMQSAAPAVSRDGSTVFIVDASGNIFSINAASGSLNWTATAVGGGCGLIVNGDELVVGTASEINFLKVSDGSVISKITLSTKMVTVTGFAVAADKNTAYFPTVNGAGSVNLSTHSLIVEDFAFATNNTYLPCVSPNGTVTFGSKDGYVYNVSANLTNVNWKNYNSAGSNSYNFSRPCADAENRIYITSGQSSNVNYVFAADGSIIDSWTYSSGDASQKQMAGNNYLDGVLYSMFIGASGTNGIFVGKYVGGTRASGWSTQGGDICGSCCIK